jgi:hypothetical protein
MMKLRRRCKLAVNIGILVGFLSAAILVVAQRSVTASDADQIRGLMASLSNRSKTPVEVLDPTLMGETREKNLGHFSASPYELTVVPNGGAPVISGDTASVAVRVHYKAEDDNSLDANATAQFVKRNGVWYFANYNFMKWPVVLIVVLVLGVLIGIAYAAAVLFLSSRLVKQGPLGANAVKMFIPFFWPFLFRQARLGTV